MVNHRDSRAQDARTILNLIRLPARLNSTETAVALGFQEHDIPILTSEKLLVPLGKPAPNSPKFFAAVQILALAENVEWLAKSTKVLANHWKVKNAKSMEERRASTNVSP
jgi:hypothetical protein